MWYNVLCKLDVGKAARPVASSFCDPYREWQWYRAVETFWKGVKARYGSLKECSELSFTPQPRPGAAGKKVRRRLTMEGMSSMAGSHQRRRRRRRRRRRLWTAGVSGVGGTLSLLFALTFSSHTVSRLLCSLDPILVEGSPVGAVRSASHNNHGSAPTVVQSYSLTILLQRLINLEYQRTPAFHGRTLSPQATLLAEAMDR